jgi:ABC-type Na+ efflux pump permease subunit
LNSRGLVIVAVVAIAILLVGSIAFSHSVEAKKRKSSEIKVYVSNVREIKHKLLLRACIADDDDCFTKEKTIDLQKHSGDKRATVAT